mgnify:CR=1 FL=1
MLTYALAIVILTGPGEPANVAAIAPLRPALQLVALHLEILDTREVRYVLTRDEDFAGDLKLLRRRWQELEDAPPLHDCMRFPDRALINDLLAFNRAYRQYLENRQSLEMTYWWELREAVQEADALYRVYDLIRDAQTEYYYLTVRRQALKKLRDELGFADYSSGRLPPVVPLQFFQRIH